MPLPVNVDFDQLPFIRPAAQPTSVINHPPFIRMEGHSFTTRLTCIECGEQQHINLSLYLRLSEKARSCDCGGRLFAPGFYSDEVLRPADLSPASLQLKLEDIGFRDGDVITVDDAPGDRHHFEIGTLQHDE